MVKGARKRGEASGAFFHVSSSSRSSDTIMARDKATSQIEDYAKTQTTSAVSVIAHARPPVLSLCLLFSVVVLLSTDKSTAMIVFDA